MNRNSLKLHLVEGLITYGFKLHLRVVIALHHFGGVLGQPSDTFFWALTISWSQLVARVCSDP